MIEVIFYPNFSGMVFRFIKPHIPRTMRGCLREPELSTEQSRQQGADHKGALRLFLFPGDFFEKEQPKCRPLHYLTEARDNSTIP
jgi:hypothetical protein